MTTAEPACPLVWAEKIASHFFASYALHRVDVGEWTLTNHRTPIGWIGAQHRGLPPKEQVIGLWVPKATTVKNEDGSITTDYIAKRFTPWMEPVLFEHFGCVYLADLAQWSRCCSANKIVFARPLYAQSEDGDMTGHEGSYFGYYETKEIGQVVEGWEDVVSQVVDLPSGTEGLVDLWYDDFFDMLVEELCANCQM